MARKANIKFEDTISTHVSDFPSMVENFTLVDKTYAIRDFVCDGSPMHLLLRPRRSGKSLFLSMMRYVTCSWTQTIQTLIDSFIPLSTYLEIPAVGENLDQRRNLFLAAPLMVSKEPFFEQYFAKFPIININLSVRRNSHFLYSEFVHNLQI